MDSKTFNSLSEAYSSVYTETVDEAMTVTNADKKGNTPAYQAYKAGKKDKGGKAMYKAADHMKEGDGDPCWDSHKQVGMKKKGGKMVPNCVPKNEEVETEVEEGYKELSRDKRNNMFRKAGNLSRTALQGGDKGTEAHKKSGKIVKALNKDAEKYDRNDVKKEELEATGLFTEEEINAILEADEQFDEAMSSYDRNRKRAAQRAADRNAARAAGKTGVVPGVGYVTPRKEKESYTDEKGTERHKSGAKAA